MHFSELTLLPLQAGYIESFEQYCAAGEVVCLRQEGQHGR